MRPADVLEESIRYPVGVAIDLVIRTAYGLTVNQSEVAKGNKYAEQLKLRPDVGFLPFGVDLHGRLGRAAAAKLGEYTRMTATAIARDGSGATRARMAAPVTFARAFARAIAAQARTNALTTVVKRGR